MRRIISRTRTGNSTGFGRGPRRFGFGRDYEHDHDYERDVDREVRERLNEREAGGPPKKTSPIAIVIVLVVIAGLIGAAVWWGSKSTQETKQTGPQAVTEAVINALGNNSIATAKNYVAEGDASVTTQVDNLFKNYEGYFIYEDDYIKWENMTYAPKDQTDSAATVEVAGTAVIVEVTYEEVWDDFEEDYVEEKVESSDEEYDFSPVEFKLKKVGEEWYLLQVPATIF